jgi:selenocysteine lyase/cysteine desulfurase
MTLTSYDSPLLPLTGQATTVPLLDGRAVRYANLDVAASAPALASVTECVNEVLPWYASVHRGAGYLSQVSTSLYEQARRTIGDFVDVRDDDVTVITRNTTDSTNVLAQCVPGRVLVLDVEHHANLLPWERAAGGVTVLTGEPTMVDTLAHLGSELRRIDYALLAVTGASNVTGEALPIDQVVAIAHAAGTRVFVDGAQLLAHRRLSLRHTDVDYVAFSGHKLYAPFGAGALVGRRDWLDVGKPYLAGGGAVQSVAIGDVDWAPAPARHEAGSPNVIGAAALAAACEALSAIEPKDAARHERLLRARLVSGLGTIPGARIAQLWSDSSDPIGVVTFGIDGVRPGLLAAYLSAEHGIGVRDGKFCAHPLLTRLGWEIGAVRASIGVGTTAEDVDRLISGLHEFVSDDPSARYTIVDGCWIVVDDPRPLPSTIGIAELAATAGACAPELAPA